jgi:hypothetical protein
LPSKGGHKDSHFQGSWEPLADGSEMKVADGHVVWEGRTRKLLECDNSFEILAHQSIAQNLFTDDQNDHGDEQLLDNHSDPET